MNRANVKLLRDTLAKHYLAGEGFPHRGRRIGFNMATVAPSAYRDHLDDCGTAACLAGWVKGVFLGGTTFNGPWDDAADWLGLGHDDQYDLFAPDAPDHETITVPEALLVLDNLLATGKVDWSIILKRREQIKRGGYVPVSPVYGRPEAVS